MERITEISSEPNQKFEIVTNDNQTVSITLEFSDQQGGWYYSIISDNININGYRLVTSPNILRRYKRIITFGIAIITEDGTEPFLIDDFSSSRVKFYVLNADEVKEIEKNIYNNE